MAAFKVLRGSAVIPSGQNTLTLVEGTDFTLEAGLPADAWFFTITSNHNTGMGRTAGGNSQAPDDVTVDVVYSGSDVILTRELIGGGNNCRVDWEVIQYIGAPGGPNEIKVREKGNVALASGDGSASAALPGTVIDAGKVIPFITGQRCTVSATNSYNQAIHTADITGGNAVFERGGTGFPASLSYALVEFTGVNWSISKEAILSGRSGSVQSFALATPLTDVSTAFIHATYRFLSAAGLNDMSKRIRLTSNTALEVWTSVTNATDVGNERHIIWIAENPEQSVARYTGTMAGAGEEEIFDVAITPVADIEQALVTISNDSTGGGTAFPRGFINATLLNASTVRLRQSDNGQTSDYAVEVVTLPATASAAVDALAEPGAGAASAAGSAPDTSIGAGAASTPGSAAAAGTSPGVAAGASAQSGGGAATGGGHAPGVAAAGEWSVSSGAASIIIASAPEVEAPIAYAAPGAIVFDDALPAGVAVTPGAGAATGVGATSDAGAGSVAQPGAGGATGTGAASDASGGASADAGAGSATAGGSAPSIGIGASATPGGGQGSVAGSTVDAATDATAEPGSGGAGVAGAPSDASSGATAEPGTGSASVQGNTPSVTTDSSFPAQATPGAGTAGAQGAAPDVSAGSGVVSGPGAASAAGEASDASAGAGAEPGAGVAVGAGQPASLGQGVAVAPGAGTATGAGSDADVQAGVGAAPGAGRADGQGVASDASGSAAVEPGTGAAAGAGHAPAVSGGQGAGAEPGAGGASGAGAAPKVGAGAAAQPGAGGATGTGQAATGSAGAGVMPGVGGAAAQGQAPEVIAITLDPNSKFSLTLRGVRYSRSIDGTKQVICLAGVRAERRLEGARGSRQLDGVRVTRKLAGVA